MKRAIILTLIILSCGVLNYVEKEPPHEWQTARILCEWVGDDIYYISPYSPYALTKYNTITEKIDTISYLNKDSSVISFSFSDIDSCFYMIKQSVKTYDFWFGGGEPHFGDHMIALREYWQDWSRYMEDAQAVSYFYILSLDNKESKYEMNFPGQCQAIMCSPYEHTIILNTVLRDYDVSSDTHLIARCHYSFSTYLYDVQFRIIDSLDRYTDSVLWVAGSLPDSSILILKPSSKINIFKMYALKIKQESQFIDEIELTSGIDFFSIRLEPSSHYLSWYDCEKQKVHIVDVFENHHKSIKAISNSYCFSPDRRKIAFFYRIWWPRKEQRIKIESISLIE